MTKLFNTLQLDYITVRPYFTGKNLLLFSAVAVFLTAMSGNLASSLGVGLMMATLFVGYPFALSEKSNLDALCSTLSVRRKTVVQGRYLFALLLNVCGVLFALGLAAVGLAVARLAGFAPAGSSGDLSSVLLLSAVFLLVQAIQLPVYFKLGYTKAKALSLVPFVAIMAGYMAILALGNHSMGMAAFFAKITGSGLAVPLLVLGLALALLLSYRLSVAFYQKREF